VGGAGGRWGDRTSANKQNQMIRVAIAMGYGWFSGMEYTYEEVQHVDD